MLGKIIDFLHDEEGQTSTEYILLIAVVVIIVMKFKDKAVTQLGSITDNVFEKAGGKITSELDK